MGSFRKKAQSYWTPRTLKVAQLALDIFRKHPLITNAQKQHIQPLFIIGSGRSGTTLLRVILCRHPLVAIPPEAYGLINAIKKYIRYNGLDWQDLVNVVYGEFHSHPTFDYWQTDLFRSIRNLHESPAEEQSLALILNCIYKTYMDQHKPQSTIWGDKTPFNTLRLNLLNKVFPKAKYIHILRDGRDVVASYLKAKLMPSLEDACHRWNNSIDAVDKFEKKIAASQIFTVRYEDLVADPTKHVLDTCNFLGLEYCADMIENTEVFLGDDSLDHLKNTTNPINSDSVGKWRRDLNEEQQESTLRFIGSRLLRKGYSLT